MKRFYCIICKKVKRVRLLPRKLSTDSPKILPTDRVGVCSRHIISRNSTEQMKAVK